MFGVGHWVGVVVRLSGHRPNQTTGEGVQPKYRSNKSKNKDSITKQGNLIKNRRVSGQMWGDDNCSSLSHRGLVFELTGV